MVASGYPEFPVLRWSILLLISDLTLSYSHGIWSNRESSSDGGLGSSAEVLNGRISVLWLAKFAGEEDEFRAVSLKALDVGGEGWDRVVDTAVVDRNTDSACKGSRNLSSLCNSIQHLDLPVDYHVGYTFNSSKVKPLPARTRRLYLMVGHRTTGLNLSTGRGATAVALLILAFLLRSLRPGWSKCVRTRVCHCFRKWLLGICCGAENRR